MKTTAFDYEDEDAVRVEGMEVYDRTSFAEAATRALTYAEASGEDRKLTMIVLDIYEQSYRSFIELSQPRAFKDFLSHSDDDYANLANCLSANIHALEMWMRMMSRHGKRLRYEQFNEMVDTLAVDPVRHAPPQRLASAPGELIPCASPTRWPCRARVR